MRAFLDEVGKLKQPLAAHLESAEELRHEEGALVVVHAPGDTWLASALQRGNNRQVLEQALATVWGAGTAWRLVEGAGKAEAKEEPAADAGREVRLAADNPAVQTLLDIFGGRVERIEEHGSLREDEAR